MVSFFESEIYRTTNRKMELSQMYLFYHVFIEKTERYLMLRGIESYSTGGLFDDAIYITKKYGIIPLSDYVGNCSAERFYNHGPLYGEFEYGFLPNLFKKAETHELNITWNTGVSSKPWHAELKEILDRHLGKLPTEITYEGKIYTPVEFAENAVNLPLNDYIKLTSFYNNSFYKPEALFVKDNWLYKNDFYNLPIDEFMETIDSAINSGFTLVVDLDYTTELLKDSNIYCSFNENKLVNQDERDEMFDNWYTKDVHLVHLTGIAFDENGRKYYVIKDSIGKNLGVVTKKYLSENFVRGKVLAAIVHKDGIPKSIRSKLP